MRKSKKSLPRTPDLNRPRWQKEGFRYKLVSPYGKKILKEEFFALSQEPKLGLSMGVLENEEKQLVCYLINDQQAKILFKRPAKDMVLSDYYFGI